MLSFYMTSIFSCWPQIIIRKRYNEVDMYNMHIDVDAFFSNNVLKSLYTKKLTRKY